MVVMLVMEVAVSVVKILQSRSLCGICSEICCKNIVAAGLAEQCEVQLAYAIGVAEPVSIAIDTFKTGKVSEGQLVEAVRKHFDLRPAGIIKMLDLKHPIYKQTAAYGHFGRTDVLLPWEKLDKVNVLKMPFKNNIGYIAVN